MRILWSKSENIIIIAEGEVSGSHAASATRWNIEKNNRHSLSLKAIQRSIEDACARGNSVPPMWFDDLPTLLIVASALTLPALHVGQFLLKFAAYAAPSKSNVAAAAQTASRTNALKPGDAYDRIARYIEASGDSVQGIHIASRAAARHIDGAEVALNLLMADIASVMPGRFTPTVQPLRSLKAIG